jgi:hypothetical protein
MIEVIDMKNMFLLHDVDLSLFSDAKCIALLDQWHTRIQQIKQRYPIGSVLPSMERGELRYILSKMLDLDQEMQNRDSRMN